MRIRLHDLGDAGLVALGRLAHGGADHLHAKLLQRGDHGPCLVPAGIEQHLAPRDTRAIGLELRPDRRLLAGDQRLATPGQPGIGAALHQHPAQGAQRLRRIGNAVKGAFEKGDAIALLKLAGDVDQRLGADQHRHPRPVHHRHLPVTRIGRERAEDADTELVQQGLHLPELTRKVIIADDVDVVGRTFGGLLRADHMREHRLARELVAEVLRADIARNVDGNAGRAVPLRRRLAHGGNVVANERRHAGGIDEHGRRRVRLDHLANGAKKLPLAVAHDDVKLGQVGGEAGTVKIGARRGRAAIVPAVALASERRVDQMSHIDNRLKRDLGAVEGAAAGSGAGRELLRAALLAAVVGFRTIGSAGRFLEHIGDLGLQQVGHGRSLGSSICKQITCQAVPRRSQQITY